MLATEHLTSTVLGMIRAWMKSGFDHDWDGCPILADALEDAGYAKERYLRELRTGDVDRRTVDEFSSSLVLPDLAGYDWQSAFAYAGEPAAGDGSADIKAVPPGSGVAVTPFSRWDVAEVFATSEGVNDEQNWLVYGRLEDGRYFFLTAGCDYTGWG